MLRLAGQGKPLRVVDDQRCTPSYTADVADAAAALIERGRDGLYHVTNAGDCTWYEFAAEIFRQAGRDSRSHADHDAPSSAPRPDAPGVQRPVEREARRESAFPALRPWREALGRLSRASAQNEADHRRLLPTADFRRSPT